MTIKLLNHFYFFTSFIMALNSQPCKVSNGVFFQSFIFIFLQFFFLLLMVLKCFWFNNCRTFNSVTWKIYAFSALDFPMLI